MADGWKRDACAIVGVGESAHTKNSGTSVTVLAVRPRSPHSPMRSARET
ncbi:hypothetical protein ACWDTG_07270 [Rhodococcus zopfii]|nr:hypothetical protein [Rhodococcus zopfii]